MKEVFSEARDIRFGDHQNASIYKDTGVYRANAVEGRIPQETRYISNNRTETYIRLVKTDTRLHGTGWNASDSGRDGEGDRVEGGGFLSNESHTGSERI